MPLMTRATRLILVAYLVVGCLNLPCFGAANLSQHSCCSEASMTSGACCDTDQVVMTDGKLSLPPVTPVLLGWIDPLPGPGSEVVDSTPQTSIPPPQMARSRPQSGRAPPFHFVS